MGQVEFFPKLSRTKKIQTDPLPKLGCGGDVGFESRKLTGEIASVWAYDTAMEDVKLVIVRVCGSRVEADLAKCELEDAGIQAISEADTAGRMREHLAWSGAGFKILVREEDAATARELLNTPFKAEESAEADFGDDDEPPEPWRRYS